MKRPVVELGELVKFVGGGTPGRDIPRYWGGDIPWATVKDMSGNALSETQESITKDGMENSASSILEAGTVIMATRMGLGKVAINSVKMAINQDLKGLICGPRIDSRYLLHFIASKASLLETAGHGATVKGVKLDYLRALKVPLPPLDEQRRIAAILDKADAIRRKRQDVLKVADTLAQSAFLELIGDPFTNPKRWPVMRLGDLLVFLTSGSRGWARYYAENGSFFLRIQNVGQDRLNLDEIIRVDAPKNAEAERTRVQAGDVLLSITADLGRTGVIPPELAGAYINQHLAIIRVRQNDIIPEYLASFLASNAGQAQITRLNRQGVKAGLNFDDIRGLRVPLPLRDSQMKYAYLKSRTQSMGRKHEELVVQSHNLFSASSCLSWR